MIDDEPLMPLPGRVHALMQWHSNRALTYTERATDRRASRHTKESHEKLAAFHRAAADTLREVIDRSTTTNGPKHP